MIKLVSKSFLKSFFTRSLYGISVYEGISPALLATMSLSQGVKGTNNDELITSLVKGNIIRNATLQKALKQLDRKDFIPEHLNRKGSYYENKPYKISGGQNMTDIFTHSVILEQVATHIDQLLQEEKQPWKQQFTVLDIGTGHGYLAFAISSILNESFKFHQFNTPYRVIGIDSNLSAIEYCNNLSKKFHSNNFSGIDKIEFSSQSLETLLQSNDTRHYYDIVVGGFYMPPTFHEGLATKIKQSSRVKGRKTFGIWASDSTNGQSLHSFVANQNGTKFLKSQIMSTMFSMPTVKSAVSKYFVEDNQKQDHQMQSKQTTQTLNQEELREKLKLLKIENKKLEKEKAKQNLKLAIEKHSRLMNRKLTLKEMKEIPEISKLLEELNKK